MMTSLAQTSGSIDLHTALDKAAVAAFQTARADCPLFKDPVGPFMDGTETSVQNRLLNGTQTFEWS